MSESETTETDAPAEATETPVDPAKVERKKAKHRKKLLFERILKQMEFYFSDANLTKDRYLGELTRIDPAVPLEVFLKFNKIRTLTSDIKDIAKAIQKSELIECVGDTKVRRKVPLEPYDAESRTIYVESVPTVATRDWLESIFSEYGQLAYISLPKFKNSNKNKGFAFIEFKTPEEAQKCLNAFTKMGCKLSTSMSPEELTTIKTFSAENSSEDPNKEGKSESKSCSGKKEKNPQNNDSSLHSESDSDKQKQNVSKNDKKRHGKKRKSKMEDESKILKEDKEPASKKIKADETGSDVDKRNSVDSRNNTIETDSEYQSDTTKDPAPKNENTKKQDRKRQRDKRKSNDSVERKRFKKEKKKSIDEQKKQCVDENKQAEGDTNNKNIPVESENSTNEDKKDGEADASSQDESKKTEEVAKKKTRKRTAKERIKAKNKKTKFGLPAGAVFGLQVLSKTEWRILRNKYLNLQRKQMKQLKDNLRMHGVCKPPAEVEKKAPTEEEKKASEAGALTKLLQTEGVFVKVDLPEPCLDVRLTKRQVRSNIHVQHVDVKEGQTDMVVRFDTPESAQQFSTSGIYPQCRVLTGAESAGEWARAEAGRGAGRRARGRDRLLQKAAALAQGPPPPPPPPPPPRARAHDHPRHPRQV